MVEITNEFEERLAKTAAPYMEPKKPKKTETVQSFAIREKIDIDRPTLERFGEARRKISTGEMDVITDAMLESGGKDLDSEEIEALANELTSEYYEQWAGGPITKEEMDQIKKIATSSYRFYRDVVPLLEQIAGTPAYNELLKTDVDVPWTQRESASMEAAVALQERRKAQSTEPSAISEFDPTSASEVTAYLQIIDPKKYSPILLESPRGKKIVEDYVNKLNDMSSNLLDFARTNILALRQPVQA